MCYSCWTLYRSKMYPYPTTNFHPPPLAGHSQLSYNLSHLSRRELHPSRNLRSNFNFFSYIPIQSFHKSCQLCLQNIHRMQPLYSDCSHPGLSPGLLQKLPNWSPCFHFANYFWRIQSWHLVHTMHKFLCVCFSCVFIFLEIIKHNMLKMLHMFFHLQY